MTPDQFEDVRADIWAEPWKDPQLFPDCLNFVVTELGKSATEDWSAAPSQALRDVGPLVAAWAEDLLKKLQQRARSGVPFDEPPYGDQPPTDPEEL